MKQNLTEIIKNWWSTPLPSIQPRDTNLITYFDNNIRKIISVIGFRRVGKTFTLLDFANKFGKERCIYINFEDERIPKKTEVLDEFIQSITELKGNKPYILLMDEIQEIPNWSIWTRRINETTKHHLILSGSSSKLSSKEIPTELRGQTITIPIMPLNWNEFLQFKNIDPEFTPHSQLLHYLNEYIYFGGLPEIVLAEEGLRPLILTDYLSSFVDRDIIERYKLRNTEAFSDLLRLIPNIHASTYTKLSNTIKSIGYANISKTTIIRYMNWLEWSFFLSQVEVFSKNIKTRIQTAKKTYLIDNYFSSQLGNSMSTDSGHLMEQTVFHTLDKLIKWDPRFRLFYWKDALGNEIDFVVIKNNEVRELIQVTYANSTNDIKDREIKAIIKAARQLQCFKGKIITWDLEKILDIGGITIECIPLIKWCTSGINHLQ